VLKCISGLLKPKAGVVTFGGKDITTATPRAKLGLGLVHVPQDRSLFPHMTVWDNLLVGGYSVRDQHAVRGRIEEATAMFPILNRRRHAHAGSLSGGEQKQVEIARTLLLNPQLIMLGEPVDRPGPEIAQARIRGDRRAGRVGPHRAARRAERPVGPCRLACRRRA
jgi:branched-chain amino acid transport system ATP-binding protein